MRLKLFAAALLASASLAGAAQVSAQTQQTAATTNGEVRPGEPRVPLAQPAVAYDVAGHEALGGRLRTQTLAGTPDAPVRNVRIVVESRSQVFYNYVSGWATFYGEDGVRCGEGLWKTEALAPGEQAEVDTPGLRLTCTPTTWRLVATSLLTRAGDTAKPGQSTPAQPDASVPGADATNTTTSTSATPASARATVPPLEINVNGRTLPLQLGNPLELTVGKERVRIVVQPAP
ncbi:MAG: hypothetical protein M3379_18420 [Acidobacteriota bacterium]|nr:hypothetical protein [Acidobacteriota bacterium]